MKALVVIHYPMFGGPHNRVLRLHRGLAARGWQTLALLPDDAGNAGGRLRAGGVEVVQVPLRRLRSSRDPRAHLASALRFAGDVGRIRQEIRKRGVDLVIVAGLINPQAALAARMEGVPVVWQIVDSQTPGFLRSASMPLVERWADAVMFGGQALAELHFNGRPANLPSFVCSPPVDLERFSPSAETRERTRRLLRIPENGLVVGTVSNLTPPKGVEYFIRAASHIYRSRPKTWFVVIGARYQSHQRYSDQLDGEVERSLIPREQFLFVGEQTDVENYYPAMDVKLITSLPRSEGTTTTAMEAMACEVPVVATNVGAVAEVVEDGLTGFVVPARDDRALAEKTLRLLAEPQLRARLGENGRRRVRRFSVDACCDRYVEIFESAVAHHALRRQPRAGAAAARPRERAVRR